MKVALVVASNRADSLRRFFVEWDLPLSVTVCVVEDGPAKSFEFSTKARVRHDAWDTIDADDSINSHLFSKRSSAIKQYGMWAAVVHEQCDLVICLDDDCYPLDGSSFADLVQQYTDSALLGTHWESTDPRYPMRGLPKGAFGRGGSVAAAMGMWHGWPDFDAQTQIATPSLMGNYIPPPIRYANPFIYFPFSGMNFAFPAWALPYIYFAPQGHSWDGVKLPYDRFDDIWGGLLLQWLCRQHGLLLSIGGADVRHTRASDPHVNLQREAAGIAANEHIWKLLNAIEMTAGDSPERALTRGLMEADTFDDTLNEYLQAYGAKFHAWIESVRSMQTQGV